MRDFVRCLGLMVGISLRADPVRSAAAFSTAILQSVSSPLRAVGLGLLANGAATQDERQAIAGAMLTVGLSALARLMGWFSLNVRMRLRENTELYLDAHLMALTTGIPGIAHHELPEYLDRVELIRRERGYLANPFNPITWTVAAIFQVVTVIGLLAAVDPLLALLPLAGLPAAFVAIRVERAQVAQWEEHVERWRQLRLLLELDTRPAAAKEVRLYGLSDELIERRRRTYKELDAEWLQREIRATASVWVAWFAFAAAFGAALVGTAHLAQQGEITVGQFVLVLTLCGLISGQVEGLTWNITWFVRTYKAVGRLIWFSRYADGVAADVAAADPAPAPDRLDEGIRFEGVSFRYPGTERAILEAIDLHLPAGSTVALVGENGAGKTTLVKLLTRLYDPSGGRITVDGVDVRRIDVGEWRERASASFQDFGQLKLLARESVGVGDIAVVDSEPRVLDGLERAAATDVLASLPDGLGTQLGLEFDDGVDLSTGQWQKLALGRAMMRQSPLLLVLDEPTASLDATTEHALFERFAGAAREAAEQSGAITILVSHRFSTVRMADLIVVLDEGRIVEIGTHDELVRNAGTYAELYSLQAAGYR